MRDAPAVDAGVIRADLVAVVGAVADGVQAALSIHNYLEAKKTPITRAEVTGASGVSR